MASIKVKFRPSAVDGHEGAIYYQIIHDRKTRQLLSNHRIRLSDWDEKISMPNACPANEHILSIRGRILRDVECLDKIINKFDANGLTYTADDVIDEFNRQGSKYSLFNFMEDIIGKLKQNGKTRTSETYTATLNSFRKFRNNEDIMLSCINSELMEAFDAWHQSRGIAPNTISFYIRILRAVYNRAIEEEIIENRNPFRHVHTGVYKTTKRALPIQAIKRIKTLDLSNRPVLDYARDMFIISFMLRGMSFIDMAYLKKTDLKNGYIVYRRRKTGQQLTIEWTKEMQALLDKYPENSSCYLLPIIKKASANERNIYRNAGYTINHNLKSIAKMTGITIPLTLYVARHSWASIAKSKGIPLGVISEGLGHDSESTTQIYLSSLDTSVVDQANELIISLL